MSGEYSRCKGSGGELQRHSGTLIKVQPMFLKSFRPTVATRRELLIAPGVNCLSVELEFTTPCEVDLREISE
jgi:hypothetical protein